MNKNLYDSMRKQMTPSPEVRAALSEKLARPAKKRPAPWMKYGALAACAALVIGAVGVSRYPSWELILQNFRPSILETKLHSYVTVEGVDVYTTENGTVYDLGLGNDKENADAIEVLTGTNTGDLPNRDAAPSGALPGGAHVGDVPVQKGAEDYQKLMDHFNGTYPDWYGGAYLDGSGWLVVQLVEDKDPADKSLELQVLDWTGSDSVMFSSCKYSLAQLKELMDRLNALPDSDPVCRDVMAGWGVDEETNRIELTLTEVNDHILSILAELDPGDDMILVQVGQRATFDIVPGEVVGTDSAKTEDPAVHYVMPGGTTVPEDEDPIAEEPVYDGAHYDLEHLPEDLPQKKRPALVEDASASTPAYDPNAK